MRAEIITWLEKRPGDGGFYAQGDNYYFGTPPTRRPSSNG